MKKLSLLIILFSTMMHAQQPYDNYTKLWEEVQQFEEENLPKSAGNIVEKIYTKAKNKNNTPQLVKALLYQSKYALTLEEDAQLSIIQNFKKIK